jgi:hypothetical protein
MTAIAQRLPEQAIKKKKDVDHTVRWIAVIAAFVSIVAFFYFNAQGSTLAYKDAISHLDIARRVIDSPTRGLAQLGGVWLPMPHLLAVPFIWIDALYYSGFAGSILSMLAYVATSILLYKITLSLTHHKLAAIICAVVFMANPNVLYMQSTPMTELLMFMCMAGTVYGVQRWIITDHYKYLLAGAVAGLFGTLTRYESWVLLVVMILLVVFVAWKKQYAYVKTEGIVLAFVSVGALGIAMWMLWNLLIFNNILYFQIGDYAKPSLWVGEAEAAVGNWWISFMTYTYATLDNLWPVTSVLAIVGLGMMAARERFALKTLPTFSLLTLFPFFVVALEQGQRPLHVAQVTGDLYNVRFGLLMILPAAIAIGYIVSAFDGNRALRRVTTGIVLACVALFGTTSLLTPNGIAVLKEPAAAQQKSYTSTTNEVSAFLAANRTDGKILMESFGNDMVMFNARIALQNCINEGSFRIWEPAQKDPANNDIQWIVMRHAGQLQPDKVYRELYNTDALAAYDIAFKNDAYYIYERRSS